jgi:hypothetical protein
MKLSLWNDRVCWRVLCFSVLVFSLALAGTAKAQVSLNLEFAQNASDESGTDYIIWISASTSNPLISSVSVTSADGAFGGGLNGPEFWTTPIGLQGIVNSATNGLWTMNIVSNGVSQTDYFSVSVDGNFTNDFPPLQVLYPASYGAQVLPDPTISWLGPTNFADLYVDIQDTNGNTLDADDLPLDTTNWVPANYLAYGSKLFIITYTNTPPDLDVTFSVPTNSAGQPLAGWSAISEIDVNQTTHFFVGTPLPLVAHYTFDNTNYVTQDTSGNGFDLQGPDWFNYPPNSVSDGVVGAAMQFFGGGWFYMQTNLLSTLGNSFSVSVWLQTTNSSGNDNDPGTSGVGILWTDAPNGTNNCIPLAQNGDVLGFYTGDIPQNTLHSVGSIDTGQWVHIVVTRDMLTGQKAIYINGALDQTDTAGTNSLEDSTQILLGLAFDGPTGISGYTGLMDDLQIYSAVLGPQQVSYLYDNPESVVTNFPSTALALGAGDTNNAWISSGDNLWFEETTNTSGAAEAVQSGEVTYYQTSTLQTTVAGPGTLTFQWESLANDTDFDLEFNVDGTNYANISGNTSWQPEGPVTLSPGLHTLTWTASADGSTNPAEAGFLDQVVFTSESGASNQVGGHTLVAHYTFDNSANLGADTSGNGYDLNYNGNPSGSGVTQSGTAEAGGGAAYFDGGSFLSYSPMPAAVLNTLAGSFTLAFWINTTQSYGIDGEYAFQGAGIVAADIPGQYNDIVPAALDGGEIGFNTGGASDDTLNSTTDINDGNYHLIVVERNQAAGEKWIFIDGVFNNTDFATTNFLNDPVLLAVGCAIDASNPNPASTSTSQFYQGLLDDLQIYSGLLNPNEIATLFNNPGMIASNNVVTVNSNGLVAHYTFDKVGNLGADTSGNGYDLNYNGKPSGSGVTQSSTAKAGSGAAYFDGGSFLSYNPMPAEVLNTLASNFTLCFWINTTQTYGNDGEWAFQGAGLMAAGVPGVANDIVPAALDGGEIGFNTGGSYDDTLNSHPNINDGNYHHIAVTRDQASGQKQIFVDGQLNNSDSASTGLLNAPVLVAVGCQIDASNPNLASISGSGFYQGLLDDIQLYSRVLSLSEIANLYINPGQTAAPLPPPNFNTALNTTNLDWNTIEASWFVESTNTHDGVLAAESGSISGSEQSILETTVTGPLSLSFWWQTMGNDLLELDIDNNYGYPVGGLYGNQPWTQAGPYVIGPGQHTLSWISSEPLGSANATTIGYLDQVTLTPILPSDLQAVSLNAAPVVGTQTYVSLVWTATNAGTTGISYNYTDTIYLETNGNVVTSFNYEIQQPVPAGSAYTITNTLLFPGVPAGNYTLALTVDSTNSVVGNTGSNSTLAIPITVITPDLQPTAFQVSGSGVEGQGLQFTWTVVNNGPGPVGVVPFYDYFYRSTNPVFDASATLVAYQQGLLDVGSITNLTAGESVTFTNEEYLPVVPSGNYYYILYVNKTGSVFESDTTNNQISAQVHLTVPDLVPTNLIMPPLVSARQPVPIEWMDQNQGDGVAEKSYLGPGDVAEWYDSLYISTNEQITSYPINPSAIQLGNYFQGYYAPQSFAWNTPLLPGQSITNFQTVTIPDVPAGNYYVFVWANSQNTVQEFDYTNNYFVTPVPITVLPLDLAPVAFSAPPAAQSRSTIQISWIVTNMGAGTVYPQWYDNIYISPVATLDAQATLLGSFLETNVVASDSNYFSTNLVTMLGIAAGNYFLILYVNAATNVLETNMANNFFSIPIDIGSPDLAAQSLIVLTNLSSQEPISLVYSAENVAGVEALPGWVDQLYLSPDGILESNNIAMGSANGSAAPLPVGGSYTNLVNTTVPAVPAGNYFVVLDVDANNFFTELNLANNVLAQPVHISNPDLTPTNFDAPSVVSITQVNQQIEVDWSVLNQGAGTAYASWSDNVYLSATNVLDNTAVYLGGASPGSVIAPGQSYASFLTPTLPNGTIGNFFLILDVNADRGLYESTYTNNILVRPIQIVLPPTPILSLVSVQAPADAWSGQSIEVNWVLTNSGNGTVQGTFYDQVFLATDALGDNAQLYGTFAFTGEIPAGGSVAREASIALPITLSGIFWVEVQTDVSQAIFQYTYRTNETLVASQPTLVHLTPTPQLEVLSVQGPTNVFSGDPAIVSWVVTNVGDGPTSAPFWSDAVYFSQSTNYNQPDFFAIKTPNQETVADSFYLGEIQNASFLSPGGAYKSSLGVTIPKGIEGTYYFVVRTDASFQVFEPNRTGNVLVSGPVIVQLTPPPDLQVVSVIPPHNAFSGQPVSVQWAVTNFGLGQTVVSNWYDGVYISTNTVLDSTAISLGQFAHVGALDPNAGYVTVTNVTLPIGITGNYYFIVQTDVGNSVYEGAFENLTTTTAGFATFVALTPPPDLQTAILQAPTTALASHALNVTYSVINVGATVTPATQSAWQDTLYISSNSVLDASALNLATYQHSGPLPPGTGYTNTIGAVLPNTLTGTYYIFVMCDSADQVFELDKANNVAEAPMQVVITSQPANLAVLYLQAPATANAGGGILVSWAVTNEGAGDTAVTSWSDDLVLSQNTVLGSPSDLVLLNLGHSGLLGAGQSYAVSNQSVGIPNSIAAGPYYLFLVADAGGAVYEGTNVNNTEYGPIPINITSQSAYLAVTAASGPGSAIAGTTISVAFSVHNLGNLSPNNNSWIDAVYLTTNGLVADPTTVLLGYTTNVSTLPPGASYSNTLDVPLPPNAQGTYYLVVVADAGGNVAEPTVLRANGIFIINPPVTIIWGPVPDLLVTNVVAPATAYEGQPVSITWTVANAGNAAASGNWIDAAYLSLDQTADPAADIYLGLANNPTNLAPGASYTNTASFVIPQGLAGPYYVSITADFDQVLNERNLLNNTAFTPLAMQVELLPPVDLVIGTITVPTNAMPGQNMTITYSVFNTGANTAIGSWEDAIYISPTTNWSIVDPLFATVMHTGNVPPGSGYTNTVTAPMPGVLPGDYYVIVHSDILNNIPETDTSNTIASSASPVDATVQPLTLGTPATGTITQGASLYYSFNATNGETILLQFTASDPLSGNELFVSEGQMPGLGQFQYAADDPFVADPIIYLPITNSGTYYVLAYGQYDYLPTTSYSILAQVVPFSVATVQPTYGGDQGQTTFLVQGALFDSSMLFELVNATNAVTNISTILENSSTAYVTFDLAGVADGLYNLTAITGQSNQITASLGGAVTVEPGIGPNVVYSIVGPSAVAEPDCCPVTHPMSIAYGNAGDSDSAAPLILVDGVDGTLIGMTPYDLQTNEIELLGRSQQGPPNILRPQDSDTEQMYFYGANVYTEASVILPNSAVPLADSDWTNIQASVRPANIPDASWNAFWGNIQPRVGSTWGSYVQFLDYIAQGFPPDELSVAAMIGSLYTNSPNFQASAVISGTVLGDADQLPQIGVTVEFYTVTTNGVAQLGGSAVTGNNGQYSVSVLPGQYVCAVSGSPYSEYDMAQGGQPDPSPPVFNLTTDSFNQTISLYEPPPLVLPTNDSAPSLTLDSQGALHAFWYRNGFLWHTWNNSGNWVGAAPVSTNLATGFAAAATANLINGKSPGLIVVWGEQETNGLELFYSVSETAATGAYQWSQPVMLTQDSVQNSSPAITVQPNGMAVITYLKQGYGIQDDSDVYYSVVDVTSGNLIWNQAADDIVPKDGGGVTLDTNSISLTYEKTIDTFGTMLTLKGAFAGVESTTGCTGTAVAKGSGSGSFSDADFVGSVSGAGDVSFTWVPNASGSPCFFQFDPSASVGNVQFGLDFTVKNAVFQVLKAIPYPGAYPFFGKLENALNFLGQKLQLTFDNSISIGGATAINGIHWTTPPAQGFGSFSVNNATGDVKSTLNIAAKVAQKTPWHTVNLLSGNAQASGGGGSITSDLHFEIEPNFIPLTFGVNGTVSLNAGRLQISHAFTLAQIILNNPTTAPDVATQPRDDSEGWILSDNPAAAVGTTNVYGTNAVLSTVATDLYMDGAPALATDGNGVPFQVWYKEGDPYDTLFGSQIYVADFNGASWNTPVVIPGSLGINSDVCAATDNLGNRLAVWVYADSSSITTNETLDQLFSILDAGDVTFSTFNGSSWSTPQPVAVTPGGDSDLQLSYMANGNILAVWTYTDTNSLTHLVSSSWNGNTWTPLDEITSGTLNSPTAQQAGGTTTVLWAAILDTNNDTAIFESQNVGGVWTKPSAFVPALLNPPANPSISAPRVASSVAPKISFNFSPDPSCCHCLQPHGPAPSSACPLGDAYYDYSSCSWKYKKKPCVVHPLDPNAMVGPVGFGPQQWVPEGSPLDYTVEFANDPTLATAPAQQVSITVPLDSHLDPRTFRLGNFGFGGLYFTVPPNSAFYQTQIDLTATEGFYVDVFAEVNIASNYAFWTFTTIDPVTGNLPANPLLGFLPPNTNAPNGQGFVSYSISASSTDLTGAQVNAQATIVFDGQPPMSTPGVFNTLEAGTPASAVQPLPAYTFSPSFNVLWQGVNVPGGVSIVSYDIYVSENGGPYNIWLQNTTSTETAFIGQPGNSYAFYSIAHDSAGDVQIPPAVANATTYISSNLPPVIAPITNAIVTPDGIAVVLIQATDPNEDQLTYSLQAGGPTNATLIQTTTNAIFYWAPTRAYADTTNSLAVIVTDNGVPPLSTTQTFLVTVLDYLQLSVGSTNVQGGQSAGVPITLASSGGVTTLTFAVAVPQNILSNVSVQAISPQIASPNLEDLTSNVFITVNAAAGQTLSNTQSIVQLNFMATTNQLSAFVPLLASNITAFKPSGAPYVNYIAQPGTVVVVENQPLLSGTVSTNQGRTLILYGKPGVTYQLQYSTNLTMPAWQPLLDYVQTNGVVTIGLGASNAVIFYRLQEQ